MAQVESLVFDFDGILANSLNVHFDARLEAFKEKGLDIDVALQIEAHKHGSRPHEIIGWILVESGLISPDDYLEHPLNHELVGLKSQKHFEIAATGFEPVEGALHLVDWAAETYADGLAIATTASIEFEVMPFLRRHDLEDVFTAVVGKEDTPAGESKPHPYVYREAVARLGSETHLSIAIEDSPNGIRSACAAGLRVIGVTTTHSAEELIKEATMVTDRLDKIPQILN